MIRRHAEKAAKDRCLHQETRKQTPSDVPQAVVPCMAVVDTHEPAVTAYVHLKLIIDEAVRLHDGGRKHAELAVAQGSRL